MLTLLAINAIISWTIPELSLTTDPTILALCWIAMYAMSIVRK